jgi:CPA1 family monovalent cation:H+ antiporter
MNVEPRLSLLVEGESLLNDGVAAVGFALLVGVAAGGSAAPMAMLSTFLWTALGGILVGAAITGALLLLSGRTNDHLVEITLTTIAAYGSFLVAEQFHMSGVLASLTAGMIVGNIGWKGAISVSGKGHVLAFWDYAAFLANSIVFILIGGHEAHQSASLFTVASAIAISLVLLGRIVAVYPLSAMFALSDLRVPSAYQHILVWGGLRGALGLALALALPNTIPERSQIIAVAFAAVAFSIFVQGLTMPWLVQHLGLITGAQSLNKATPPHKP